MKPDICILAAGIGSRFGGFKQLKPVGPGGELLIDYSIFDARRAGFGRIVFVISRTIEPEFKEYMEGRYGAGDEFVYAYQDIAALPADFSVPVGRSKPWGTAQAVLAAREALSGVFAVINADDYYGPDSFAVLCKALGAMRPDAAEFVMVGFELSQTLSEHGAVARGVCSVKNGLLASIVEREKIKKTGNAIVAETMSGDNVTLEPQTTVSMNCWGFAPRRLFPLLEGEFVEFLKRNGNEPKTEFYLPAVINKALTRGEITVKVLRSGEQWFGMTYAEDVTAVREYLLKKIREGVYPATLFGRDRP
jgi:choline kinase